MVKKTYPKGGLEPGLSWVLGGRDWIPGPTNLGKLGGTPGPKELPLTGEGPGKLGEIFGTKWGGKPLGLARQTGPPVGRERKAILRVVVKLPFLSNGTGKDWTGVTLDGIKPPG